MPFKIFGILLLCLLGSGCRTISYSKTDAFGTKTEIWATSLISDAYIESMEVDPLTGKVVVTGYSQEINEEALKAIVEATVEAILKSAAPIP